MGSRSNRSNFGPPMSIPKAGGSTSRDHATGIDRTMSPPKKKKRRKKKNAAQKDINKY